MVKVGNDQTAQEQDSRTTRRGLRSGLSHTYRPRDSDVLGARAGGDERRGGDEEEAGHGGWWSG